MTLPASENFPKVGGEPSHGHHKRYIYSNTGSTKTDHKLNGSRGLTVLNFLTEDLVKHILVTRIWYATKENKIYVNLDFPSSERKLTRGVFLPVGAL